MKGEVKLPAIIVACLLALGVVVFGLSKAMNAGDLDQGQVKYTPGVPPWLEKDAGKKASMAGIGSAGPGQANASTKG